MDSSHLNNSFHYISFFDKIDEGEELEDKIFDIVFINCCSDDSPFGNILSSNSSPSSTK